MTTVTDDTERMRPSAVTARTSPAPGSPAAPATVA